MTYAYQEQAQRQMAEEAEHRARLCMERVDGLLLLASQYEREGLRMNANREMSEALEWEETARTLLGRAAELRKG